MRGLLLALAAAASAGPPGQGPAFAAPWRAAFHALAQAAALQLPEHPEAFDLESFGFVYRLPGGSPPRYAATAPIWGGPSSISQREVDAALAAVERAGGAVVGDYHSHGTFAGYGAQEGFSGVDRRSSGEFARLYAPPGVRFFSYLGTPEGRFLIYDPGRDLTWAYGPSPALYPARHGSLSRMAASYAR